MGDRPLRSPTHRRLGGPSPRRLANGTHARPRPTEAFQPKGMSPVVDMGYYPAFPPAVPRTRVGCIRVTHPCATLAAPEGAAPVRLACIRPAASVHPEPGSNSSLYYCCTFSFSCLGLRYVLLCLFTFLLLSLCWPQAFKEPFVRGPLFLRGENGCKGTTFFLSRKLFFTFFFKKISSH